LEIEKTKLMLKLREKEEGLDKLSK